MAFQFPLQPVLHLRESLEHQQELRLRAANQQVARVRHRIEQLDAHSQEMQSRQMTELRLGMTGAELRFALFCEGEVLRQRGELQKELVRLQQVSNQERELYQQARRARQTLETLHDQQLLIYRKQAGQREQRRLDDQFLMRREYLRGS